MWTEEEMKTQHAVLFDARFGAGVQLVRARREAAECRMRADGLRWAALKFYPEALDEAGSLKPDAAPARELEAPDSLGALISSREENLRRAEAATTAAAELSAVITALDADLDGLARLAFGYYRLDLCARPSDVEIDRAACKHPSSTTESRCVP